MAKPKKILYENQSQVKAHILDMIMNTFSNFKEVYLIGSLIEGRFGVYEEPWRDHGGQIHTGSDVDLVLFGVTNIPSSFRKLLEREHCIIYYVDTVVFEKNSHVVEAIVVKNDAISNEVMREMLKEKNSELIVRN